MCYDKCPKLVLLSETRTIENMNSNELVINKYNLIRCDSHNRHTGGVALYVHESVAAHEIFRYDYDFIWALAILVTNGYAKDIFCVIYRGHQGTNENFSNFLKFLLDTLSAISPNIHILGDFNYNFNSDSTSRNILKIAKSFCFKQLVNTPTRVTNTSSTIIDWYLTNRLHVKVDVVDENVIADHKFIAINPYYVIKPQKIKKIVYSWKNYNQTNLLNQINLINWDLCHDFRDINQKCDFIFNNLAPIVNNLVIKKEIITKPSMKWFNEPQRRLKQRKIDAYNKWKSNKTDENWKSYTSARNEFKNNLQKAERDFIEKQLESNKNNPKKLWTILKSIYHDNPKTNLKCVCYDNEVISDDQENAERLNKFFVESIELIAETIPNDHQHHLCLNVCQESSIDGFKFKSIDVETLKLLIKSAKDKTFIDNINGNVLCDAMCNKKFANAFCDLINVSLIYGQFPSKFKKSVITPLQKVKNTNKCSELRAINKLKVPEIILEKIVRQQLYDHLENNAILIKEQSGFRKNHSCETALNWILHEWKFSLDAGFTVLAVFIDLKRAFETIDRDLLVEKIKKCNCHFSVTDWFRSYLSKRYQSTKFNESLSKEIAVNIGIPQGSVLSCLIFIIFINDIALVLVYCKIKLFADDALLYIDCKNLDDGSWKINHDLDNIFKYLCASKLSLNVDKTKFMAVANKNLWYDFEIKINNVMIEQVQEFKYLGVMIDHRLSMQNHTDFISKKLNKKFYVFKRCEKKMNLHAKITYCTSLVLPHIDYCSSILFLLNKSQLNQIQLILNRFMRTVLRVGRRTPIKEMLEALKWMSVKQRVVYNSMMFINKISNNQCPQYLSEKLQLVSSHHQLNTRQANEYAIPICKKVSTKNSLFVNGVSIYNSINKEFKKTTVKNGFKNFLIKYVKENF